MLSKIIILTALLLGIWFLFFRKHGTNLTNDGESFVQCHKCLTFVELKNTKLKRGKYICDKCLKKDKNANYRR